MADKLMDMKRTVKICRICLLARDQSPLVSDIFGCKKEPRENTISLLRKKFERAKQYILELAGAEIAERPEDNELISPCHCKGTMRFVHRGCLNLWRMNSSRADSYYKCEQCFHSYKFTETQISKVFASPIIAYLISTFLFLFWIYGWFLFVQLSQSMSGAGLNDFQYDCMSGCTNSPGYNHNFFVPVHEQTRMRPSATMTSTRHAYDPFSDTDSIVQKEENSKKSFSFFNLLLRLANGQLLEVSYTVVIVALFDFLITNPSIILSANLIYLIWRCIKSGGPVEIAWISGCVSFGLARTFRTIYQGVTAVIQRYVKLRCIEIVDQDEKS